MCFRYTVADSCKTAFHFTESTRLRELFARSFRLFNQPEGDREVFLDLSRLLSDIHREIGYKRVDFKDFFDFKTLSHL